MASKEKSGGGSSQLKLVQSTIKACVISNPEGVAEEALNNEFRQLMGSAIPWRELGFKSLPDLLSSCTDLKVVESRGRRMVVANNDKSDHLSSLISGQKKTAPKRKKTSRVSLGRYGGYRLGRGGSREPSYRPRTNNGFSSSSYNYNNGFSSSSYNHNNFSYPLPREAPPPVRSKVMSPPVQNSASPSQYYGSLPREAPPPIRNPPPKPLLPLPHEAPSAFPANAPLPPLSLREPPLPSRQDKPLWTPPGPKIPPPKTPPKSPPPKNPSPPKSSVTPPKVSLDSKKPKTPETPPLDNGPTESDPSAPASSSYVNPAQKRLEAIKHTRHRPRGGRRGGRGRGVAHAAVRDTGPPPEGSFHQIFVSFALSNNWPAPEYTVLPRTSEERSMIYAATLTGTFYLDLNQQVPLGYDFSTIPDEFEDPCEAKEEVSRRALSELSERVKSATAPMLTTYNVDLMTQRILQLVSGCPNGFWAYKVEADYKAKFGECLPPDWVSCLSSCPSLTAEKYNEMFIISPTLEDRPASPNVLPIQVPELEFPDTEDWDIYVTLVMTSSEVWFRFIGPNYSDKLMKMSEEMIAHYRDWEGLVCDCPVLGGLYVHPVPYPSRVRLLSLDSNQAQVLMVDHGEVTVIKANQICSLTSQFARFPPQAVCASMKGLEELENSKLVTCLLRDKLEGKALVTKADREPLSLVVYDTSYQDPVNINSYVLTMSTINIFHPPPSITDGSRLIWEVRVTSVWKTADVYIQVANEGLDYVENELSDMEVPEDSYLVAEEELEMDSLYLYSSGECHYRATLLRPVKVINNLVEILLVDTGEMVSTEVSRLAPLHLVSCILKEIPKQAILVSLSGLTGSLWEAERLREIVPVGSLAMAKPVTHGPVPSVELFVREPVTKALISVNTTIMAEALDQPAPQSPQPSLTDNMLNLHLNGDSPPAEPSRTTGQLRLTKTPDLNDYFNVYIICVSNPSNFTVIPHKYLESLMNLQDKITEFYHGLGPGSHKLTEYYPGQPCAVLHTDNTWNRGIVEKVLAPGECGQLCVRFCDFGNLTFVSTDSVRSLNPQFMLVPALGITASLAGIEPVYQDWSVEDISRVQDLLLEKELLTIIRDKRPDESLSLQVFTSLYPDVNSSDYDISAILIAEGRARRI